MSITWILESEVYRDKHQSLKKALDQYQIRHLEWQDEWLQTKQFPNIDSEKVIFHGCLANAHLLFNEKIWSPGAYCDVERFLCSSWYNQAKGWLIQDNWKLTTVKKLVESPYSETEHIKTEEFFVRPNSPLKPFSGRVLNKNTVSYQALDFGFYFNNEDEEIVISDLKSISKEWRYVVCNNRIITGSSYLADNRSASGDDWKGTPFITAQDIARQLLPPEEIYIMDICYSNGDYKLLELNPFSGADLYSCNREDIVRAINSLYSPQT